MLHPHRHGAMLQPIAAFRLLEFRYPVSAYLAAVGGERRFPFGLPKRTWVAVYRHAYHVLRLDLTRRGFVLLSALAAGASLGEAVSRADVGDRQLFQWFEQWTSEGLFQAVTAP